MLIKHIDFFYEQVEGFDCYTSESVVTLAVNIKSKDMENFKDIISGDQPVLVDFYATWCGPCKAMAPVVESLGKEVAGKGRVLKIDVDKNGPVANQYRIQSVPTFIIFKKGEAVWRVSGVVDKAVLLQQMQQLMD